MGITCRVFHQSFQQEPWRNTDTHVLVVSEGRSDLTRGIQCRSRSLVMLSATESDWCETQAGVDIQIDLREAVHPLRSTVQPYAEASQTFQPVQLFRRVGKICDIATHMARRWSPKAGGGGGGGISTRVGAIRSIVCNLLVLG